GVVTTVAFSPDGAALVSAAHDGTMLVWDVAALLRKPQQTELSAAELKTLWERLASFEPSIPSNAMARLIENPEPAIRLLRESLKPVSSSKAEIAKLIGDLDHGQFAVRDEAMKRLAQLADVAEPALRASLEGKVTLEHQRRIEKLLTQLHQPISRAGALR